jgi:hypothetical protein
MFGGMHAARDDVAFCSSCHAEATGSDRFCRQCGAPLVPPAAVSEPDAPAPVAAPSEATVTTPVAPPAEELAAAAAEPSPVEPEPEVEPVAPAQQPEATRILLPLFPFKLFWSPRKLWSVKTSLGEDELSRIFEATILKKPSLLRRRNNYFRRVRWTLQRHAINRRLIATCHATDLVQVGFFRWKIYVDPTGNTIECGFDTADDGRTTLLVGVTNYTTWLGFYLFPPALYLRDVVRNVWKADRAARVRYPWSPFRFALVGLVLVAAIWASLSGGGGAGTSGQATPAASPPPPPASATPSPAPSPPPPAVSPPPAPAPTPSTGALPDRPSTSASQLVAEIDRSDEIIRDPSSTAQQLKAAGQLQQLAIGLLRHHPDLRSRTLPAISPRARSAIRAGMEAAAALSVIVPPQKQLPDWRIVAPPRPRTLLADYREAQATYGVPWEYLAAIELVETRMGRIRGASQGGAQGPMQFVPATWAKYGRGDVNNNHDAVLAAARLLVDDGAPADMPRALYDYNPSHGYVKAIQLYAGQMQKDPRTFYGYYYWQVLYRHVKGLLLLPVGYPAVRPMKVG